MSGYSSVIKSTLYTYIWRIYYTSFIPNKFLDKMIANIFAPLLLLGSALAVPAPIPSGGVGVRTNDTPPAYAVMSDCELLSAVALAFLLGTKADPHSRFPVIQLGAQSRVD